MLKQDDYQVWIPQRADPYVIKSDTGYYFTASVPQYDRIVLRHAPTLDELAEAEEVTIWQKHASGPMSQHIWAPEMHYLFGAWYIYFAASEVDDIWKLRPYVLKCLGDDPMQDEWVELGKMKRADDDPFSFESFSLDATVFEVDSKWYYVWAEKVGHGKQISNLYIAEMEDASTLSTPQVLLTTPDYDWERVGFWVNEGPAVIKHEGKIHLTFRASDTGPAYCVGVLTAELESDLLDPASWTKFNQPIMQSKPELQLFGPGHNSFTLDEEGRDVIIFHARTTDQLICENPLYDPNRHAMKRLVEWSEDGRMILQ